MRLEHACPGALFFFFFGWNFRFWLLLRIRDQVKIALWERNPDIRFPEGLFD